MSHEPESQDKQPNGGLRRRDFLALAPATVALAASAALPRAAFADASPLQLDLKAGLPLSVGYIEGSEAWLEGGDLPWQYAHVDHLRSYEIDVVPAEGLLVGSELANRQIELTVHGLVPGLPQPGRASWTSAFVFASLPAPPDLVFGPDPVPFLAWSARADRDPRQAAKVRPILETGGDGSLYVGVEIHSLPGKGDKFGGRSGAKPVNPVTLRTANFTVDATSGRPSLQAGVYLLGFAADIWRRSWSGTLADLASAPGLESVAIGVLPLD